MRQLAFPIVQCGYQFIALALFDCQIHKQCLKLLNAFPPGNTEHGDLQELGLRRPVFLVELVQDTGDFNHSVLWQKLEVVLGSDSKHLGPCSELRYPKTQVPVLRWRSTVKQQLPGALADNLKA